MSGTYKQNVVQSPALAVVDYNTNIIHSFILLYNRDKHYASIELINNTLTLAIFLYV